MKKITILALHLGYGGIERCIATLANNLIDNYDVEIISTYKLYKEPAFPISKKVKIKYLTNLLPNKKEFKNALRNFKLFTCFKLGITSIKVLYLKRKLMIKAIKNSNSDIIISTRDYLNKYLGKYSKNALKIGWEHNHHHDNTKYIKKIINSTKKLDYLVLVSNSLKEFYQNRCKCKCIYIPNMIDYIPEKTSLLEEKRLISVGRLSKEKGYEDLIKVYNMFYNTKKDYFLDIIGDGIEKENIKTLINEYKLENNIKLHGFQNKDYINNILEKSSIYLMCSYTESFGLVLIEAMSYGIPCIAFSSAEGANDIIENGYNGYLVNNRDKKEMTEKIILLCEDSNLRKKMGENARKTALKYSSLVVIKKWINLFEEGE